MPTERVIRRNLRRLAALALSLVVLSSLSGVGQSWPRCNTGCTAKDVELIGVTAEILGSCSAGGPVEAMLWASLHFNRNRTYCVRFVADVYVDGRLAVKDLISEAFNVHSKGTYPDVYLGTVSLTCGSSLTLENITVMWSVDNKLDPVSRCQDGTCADYGPASKCTGDQLTRYPVSMPLEAFDDEEVTDEETAVTTAVLSNDLLGLPPTSIIRVTDGAHGRTEQNADGTITYTPDRDFDGLDAYSYTIQDSDGRTDSATVSIAILPINDPPIAEDDAATTDENDFVNIDLTANDTDPDGSIDPTTVTIVDFPREGTLDVDPGTGVATYTPDPGYCGSDRFTYEVSNFDGAVSAEAMVTIDVVCNLPPRAEDDAASTDENTSIGVNVLANDEDGDGAIDAASITITTPTRIGELSVHATSGVVTYTPNPGACGLDSFRYTVVDDDGATSNEAAVTIDVMCDDPPLAIDDASTTNEDTPLAIPVLSNDSDPDEDRLTIQSVTQPSHGAAVPSATSIVYTPSPNYAGTDSFTYTVSDGHGGTDTATVTLTVLAVNDPPIAQNDNRTTVKNSPIAVDVLANDEDPDGDPLAIQSVTHATNGTVANRGSSILYTPYPQFSGIDSFSYTVTDGQGGSDTARVTITVVAFNDRPIAQDDAASTDEGRLVTISVLENDSDPDGDFLLVETFTQPANGSVLNTRTSVSYIPNDGFQGTDTFSYTVSDGNGGTDSATVTVSVAAVNDPPIARDDTASTDEGAAVIVPVLLNDEDSDGDSLIVRSIAGAEHGTVVNLGTEIEYSPDSGFNGVDRFVYTISDGNGGGDAATVFVAVAGVNDPPVAQDDSGTTEQNGTISIPVLANDEDPDGDSISIASTSLPEHGTVRIDGGTLVYTPDPDYIGTDRLTYRISDGRGAFDEATVTVGILAGGRGGATDAASCEGRVIISEIAWAGTSADPRDEWIELRNLGTSPVDLSGWTLRWRPTHPTTSEDQIWKTIELAGLLEGAETAACGVLATTESPSIRIEERSSGGLVWTIAGQSSRQEPGYYTLERRTDDTITDRKADFVYDETTPLRLELSDGGDIVMLIDESGEVVDTANASNLGRFGWVAGSATTFGTMERIDPLRPDVSTNWHTNLGIVAGGEDAFGRPLRATPAGQNSPVLDWITEHTEIDPMAVKRGETPQLRFALSRQDRRETGWPWIHVTRPGFAGQGGAIDPTRLSFAGQHEGTDEYVLDIGTGDLSLGAYSFLIIYGEGKGLLLPILVTP